LRKLEIEQKLNSNYYEATLTIVNIFENRATLVGSPENHLHADV